MGLSLTKAKRELDVLAWDASKILSHASIYAILSRHNTKTVKALTQLLMHTRAAETKLMCNADTPFRASKIPRYNTLTLHLYKMLTELKHKDQLAA